MFDKQIQLRMGQANVKRWVDDILPLLTERDPLGVEDFATHHVPLSEAPKAYQNFQQKTDGTVKVALPASLRPNASSVSPARGGEVGAPVGHAVVGDHVGVEAGL